MNATVIAMVVALLLPVPSFTLFMYLFMPAESKEAGFIAMFVAIVKVIFYFPASLIWIAIKRRTHPRPYNYRTHIIVEFFRFVTSMEIMSVRYLMDLPGFLAQSIIPLCNTPHGRWMGPDVPPEDPDALFIFFVHGGRFVFGSPILYLYSSPFFLKAFKNKKARVFSAKYTLAPGMMYPKQIQELLECYQYFCSRIPRDKMVVMGDSAGGNLILSLLLEIYNKHPEMELPKGCVAISPWIDLTRKESDDKVAPLDYLEAPYLQRLVKLYVPPGVHLQKSTISPYFASEEELKIFKQVKLFITYGGLEYLAPQITEFAQRVVMTAGPENVTIDCDPQMVHVYQCLGPLVIGQAAKEGNDRMAKWIIHLLGPTA
jgi:acetyl esterase/lipase